jgi:hypothetical protein
MLLMTINLSCSKQKLALAEVPVRDKARVGMMVALATHRYSPNHKTK